jgi:hypothetical protein
LWGILAGLLRFIPYVGTIVALLGPLALAAAVAPGWDMVIWVALLFVVVEPVVGYVIEPLLYGHSAGLSPVSVVVAALFWTWIWGPIGLVLSMPLTLVLVVLGRHIPAFEVFDILLGDRPALSPAESFYQRALAGHAEEAVDQAENLLETRTLGAYYEEVVLGALRLAIADVDRGAVERSSLRAVCETVLEILETLADYRDPENSGASLGAAEVALTSPNDAGSCIDLHNLTVICVPGRGPLDAAVAAMMAQLLGRAACTVHALSRDTMRRDGRASLAQEHADAICILGLFDERSFRRLRPMVQQGGNATVLIGVRRTDDVAPVDDGAGEPLPNLHAFLEALQSAKSSKDTLSAPAHG